MSALPIDFKITPPKVKQQKGTSTVFLVFRSLVYVIGPSAAPLTVYLVEGCTNLFLWMLGFGSVITLILLISDHGKVIDSIQHLKKSCCRIIYKRKLLQVPFHRKNLSPLKLGPTSQNSPGHLRCQILDGFDLPQSTTPNITEVPISIDCPTSSFASTESGVPVSQQITITPTKRRMVSASSVSLSPLKNQMDASTKTSPFSKKRLGFPGCLSPRLLKDTTHLSTVLESPNADYNDCNLKPRRLSCYSS